MDLDENRNVVESILREQCLKWLGSLFKNIPANASVEDLLSNAFLLGRIAELFDASLRSAPLDGRPSLAPRPFKDIIEDMQRFYGVQKLYSHPSNHLSLSDVHSCRSGLKECLCLWDLASALQGLDSSMPAFASSEDVKQFNSIMPREFVEERASHYRKSMSPTLMDPPKKECLPGNEGVLSSRGVAHSNNGQLSSSRGVPESTSFLSNPPSLAPRMDLISPLEESPAQESYMNDVSTLPDPLEALLSPEKLKPSHSRLLNSIMHSSHLDHSDHVTPWCDDDAPERAVFTFEKRLEEFAGENPHERNTKNDSRAKGAHPWMSGVIQRAGIFVLGSLAGLLLSSRMVGRDRAQTKSSPWDSPNHVLVKSHVAKSQ